MANVTGPAAAATRDLLEREVELARMGDLLADARVGQGRVLLVEGPAGIGKTALLEATCRLAARQGFGVLRARGGELEREFPHGVVRQLFEAHMRGRSSGERAALLDGAAALAAPVVLPESSPAAAPASASDQSFAVAHGFYWLTANLADEQPLLLAIDDAHWSDVPSLRFLLHLARRIEGMPILLAVGVRSGEPGSERALIAKLSAEPDVQTVRPPPLSEHAVGELIAARLGERPEPEFAQACHRATGGTPFLINELASALREAAIRPSRDAVSELSRIGPETVTRATLLRLARLPAAATEIARAVAILGADGLLNRVARLARVEHERAVEAVDALVSMNVLQPGRPLDFVHPLVRSAVYGDIPPATRAAAHARAAELLAEQRADLDSVATHLLLTEPEGRAETVERLHQAARRAMARGAPESASSYLARALRERAISAEDEAALLFELGRAERRVRPEVAVEHMRQAHRLATDPTQRAEIAYHLADTLLYRDWDESSEVAEAALEDAESDPELVIRLETLRTAQDLYHRRVDAFTERLPRMRALAGGDTPAQRLMALYLAGGTAWFRQPPGEVRRLLEMGLRGSRLLEDEGPESWVAGPVFHALILTEAFDEAIRLADDLVAVARRRGSMVGFGYSVAMRAWVYARQGDLLSADADIRTALDAIRGHGLRVIETGTLFQVADALIERPELEDETERLLAIATEAMGEATVGWPMLLDARGRIRLARGEVEAGIEDLERCDRIRDAHGNPNGFAWRPALALALARSDRERALELARRNLRAAHQVQMPRAIGVGLRTLGVVEGGAEGLAHLEEAVAVLADSPARLEHARALVELGAARRRANQRAAAREPLRQGLDLAHRCGATRLAQRARDELAASGARPRREMITGRDALTATEQRIAAMAADGMSNPQIAQALFVTRKTVENHLGRIYPKLGIRSRDQLAAELENQPEPA